jgi:hypothetical protein
MHPAESRGYRELLLTAEEARARLKRLAGHLELDARAVADKAVDTLGDMTEALKPALAEHDLHGEIAARGGGARIGTVRAAILDRFLERNQALRFAVDDLEHVTNLLAYVANVSEARQKKTLPELCRTWERKMRRQVSAVRKAAVELGSDPDEAIEPIDPTPIGKAAHGAAVAVGTAGEAVDKAAATVKASGVFDADAGNGKSAGGRGSGDAAPESDEKPKRGFSLFRRK